ncbi:hypothetical protein D3C79_997950 [compost metagenome]
MVAHPQQHRFLAQAHGLTQFGRDQHAARPVHVHVHGVAQEDAFPPLRGHGQLRDAIAKLQPLGPGEKHETTMGVFGDGDLTLGHFIQGVTVPGRH